MVPLHYLRLWWYTNKTLDIAQCRLGKQFGVFIRRINRSQWSNLKTRVKMRTYCRLFDWRTVISPFSFEILVFFEIYNFKVWVFFTFIWQKLNLEFIIHFQKTTKLQIYHQSVLIYSASFHKIKISCQTYTQPSISPNNRNRQLIYSNMFFLLGLQRVQIFVTG